MAFRKLRSLVSRQAQAAASKETTNIQPSSDDEQPEPTLVCSPRSSATADEVPITVVTNKGCKRKRQISESEGDKGPVTTANEKGCKRKKQNPEIQYNLDPFDLIINYFDKRFEKKEKKLQQPSIKAMEIEYTFKFKHKGNRVVKYKFNEKILQTVQNLSSTLNNADAREAMDLCDDLTVKLKCRNKMIKMADRSVVDWENVAKCETDPIASDSDDGKKTTKRKSKNFKKPTVCVPSQRPSGQQFGIDDEHNGFTPSNQRYFNFRFPLHNFAQNSCLRSVQWSSSFNIRLRDMGFGSGKRRHWRKYCSNSRYRN